MCSSVLTCNLFATQLVELRLRKCDYKSYPHTETLIASDPESIWTPNFSPDERLQQQQATHLEPNASVGADFRDLVTKMGLERFLRV